MDSFSLTLAIVSLLCLVVGTPLNFLAVAYFAKSPSRTLANRLFMTISSIDGLLCLSMLNSFIALVRELEKDTATRSVICIVISWIWNIVSRLSLFLSSVLSVTRAVSLYRPFSSIPTRPIVALVAAELVYLILYECSPSFTSHRVPVYNYGNCDWSVDKPSAVPYQMFYSLAYCLPLILTIGSSLASFCLLRRNKTRFGDLRRKEANTYQKQCYAANTIFILVIVYALCNVPYGVVLLLMNLEIISGYDIRNLFYKEFYSHCNALGSVYLVAINAAATPLVFLLRIQEFRTFIKRASVRAKFVSQDHTRNETNL